jgi:hypothetical protein
MPVSLSELDMKNGESILIRVNGSELRLTVFVSDEGHCFISHPHGDQTTVFSFTGKGLTRARGMEERMKALLAP